VPATGSNPQSNKSSLYLPTLLLENPS
jgi:hypothetical protein